MKTGEFCNREVVIASQDLTVLEAAKLMRQYHVGNVVVVEKKENRSVPVGIFTDRDIVIELLAKDIDPALFSIGEVMTFELTTAWENDDIIDTVKKMKLRGIRRIPVVDEKGFLTGILALEDVIELVTEQLSDLVGLCRKGQKLEAEKRP
ncbi:MAG: CBS domain-containing protein [Deltaproteobacteria bacterium]|nr:CBS domain-containing protein [Deltaproteobacteria bacterium]